MQGTASKTFYRVCPFCDAKFFTTHCLPATCPRCDRLVIFVEPMPLPWRQRVFVLSFEKGFVVKTNDIDDRKFIEAVKSVQDEIELTEGNAGADYWPQHSEYRRRMFELVRDRYCDTAKCKRHNFVYSEDGVVVVWTRIRKDKKTKRAKRQDAEQPTPMFAA